MSKRCHSVDHFSGKHVVTFRNVTFGYGHEESVLHKVSLDITTHANVCLIGPNGSGKTTLLKLILGLLTPGQGEILVFGNTPHRACSNIGYVPQHAIIRPEFPVTVHDVVMMGCVNEHLFGWHRRSCHQCFQAIFDELGIEKIRNRQFADLSGGQRQRVLIARALIANPRLLLLDEPTANIDPLGANNLRQLLKQLSSRMTVVTVSHDLRNISTEMDQVILVNRGIRSCDPAEVDPNVIFELFREPLQG